jgi:uncharacterized damage-inducible protein DinB
MKLLASAVLFAAAASAQTTSVQTPANPLIATSKGMFAIAKGDILGSLKKVDDTLWSFRPSDNVRTMGQLFAHVADAQYEFCGTAAGENVSKDIEKTLKTKAEITPALNEAFGYCDSVYTKMTDANAAEVVTFFGMKITKLGAMDFNIAHTMEHYGNLVTYMRIKGIVPPSSEPRQPAAAKKQ